MSQTEKFDRGLLRMGGIAAILAGSLILFAFVVAESNGVMFFSSVYEGGSAEPWMKMVLASPSLSQGIMVLPALGFSCMLLVMGVMRQVIEEGSWQKTLATAGYGIGVPVAVIAFTLQLSLMNEVLLVGARRPELSSSLELVASVFLYAFHVVNHYVGPFLIIVMGTGMMAWAALRSAVLPRWLCIWLMTCAVTRQAI